MWWHLGWIRGNQSVGVQVIIIGDWAPTDWRVGGGPKRSCRLSCCRDRRSCFGKYTGAKMADEEYLMPTHKKLRCVEPGKFLFSDWNNFSMRCCLMRHFGFCRVLVADDYAISALRFDFSLYGRNLAIFVVNLIKYRGRFSHRMVRCFVLCFTNIFVRYIFYI